MHITLAMFSSVAWLAFTKRLSNVFFVTNADSTVLTSEKSAGMLWHSGVKRATVWDQERWVAEVIDAVETALIREEVKTVALNVSELGSDVQAVDMLQCSNLEFWFKSQGVAVHRCCDHTAFSGRG